MAIPLPLASNAHTTVAAKLARQGFIKTRNGRWIFSLRGRGARDESITLVLDSQ